MKSCNETNTQTENCDFLQMMSIICYLMTSYSMKPCEHLAQHINEHLEILLNSPHAEHLGDWQPAFMQLQCKWRGITDLHIRSSKKARTMKQSMNIH